jgi:thioredoxin 1
MEKNNLENIVDHPGKATVVEFWAAWCGPCRAMEPNLEKAAREFSEKVYLERVNIDENQELASRMKIYAIPTMVAFKNGSELFRKTGSQNLDSLRSFFHDTASGMTRVKEISPWSRMIKLGAAFFIIVMTTFLQGNWLWYLLGGLLAFWAVYDRCPIYKSIKSWFKSIAASD